ncbi:MAG: hypothetical protein ABI472_05905 [Ginsengibacter sp.]
MMQTAITARKDDKSEAENYRPAISIFMPFEPKMSSKSELKNVLKAAANKVELKLQKSYPDEVCMLVMWKLRAILRELNFNTHKKSIAIYVSPVFEKILYLDIAVEEKIIVDDSFEIRDLVNSKKQLHKYLILLLSDKESRMYLGNTDSFVKIISDTPERVYASLIKVPGKADNFCDTVGRGKILMDKFLHHIDTTLNIILKAYHLPLFVLGSDKMIGHFKNCTKHEAAVIDYVPGNYDKTTLTQLKEILNPYVNDWKKVREKDLMNQLEKAAGDKKLTFGMGNVWREAMNRNSSLLLVENKYIYDVNKERDDDIHYKETKHYDEFSYIKDAVDDIIEKVLESGGDVEFADANLLKNYHHIALVQNY